MQTFQMYASNNKDNFATRHSPCRIKLKVLMQSIIPQGKRIANARERQLTEEEIGVVENSLNR